MDEKLNSSMRDGSPVWEMRRRPPEYRWVLLGWRVDTVDRLFRRVQSGGSRYSLWPDTRGPGAVRAGSRGAQVGRGLVRREVVRGVHHLRHAGPGRVHRRRLRRYHGRLEEALCRIELVDCLSNITLFKF